MKFRTTIIGHPLIVHKTKYIFLYLLKKAVVEIVPGLKLTTMAIPVSIKGTLKSIISLLSVTVPFTTFRLSTPSFVFHFINIKITRTIKDLVGHVPSDNGSLNITKGGSSSVTTLRWNLIGLPSGEFFSRDDDKIINNNSKDPDCYSH
ncbi:hypothetical protein BpHYR1_016650 [Brachionus plicatilis]|uniref:Uncharacterized protein n=1 Tax=Brachionus plicatilis TaxID=10195 RepID=A0A3M7RAY6_BRAPC|nr:hypothetical protein BpHYR1_016650 [Brachionus plicatilis]